MAALVLQPGIGGLLVSSSVCAMRAVGGRLWLVAVVAVGESSDVVELVGIDGGGGWDGMIVGCLLMVDDNKLSVRVC